MKIILAGGTGHLGGILERRFRADGHAVVVLSRDPARGVAWDGRSPGAWTRELDGADAVINLAGRSVNCRYTAANLREMMDSRVESARAVGRAIAEAARPPRAWLQMSTATIYAHRFDAPNDEATGVIGGAEPDAPAHWKASIDIATAWEAAQREAVTPRTRKVALRTAMVMSPAPGAVFDILHTLARRGLGGPIAGGRQYVSWIHDRDFARAVELLLDHPLEGPVNLAAPEPLPQREFMAALRRACGARIGLPATRWMLEIGTFFMRSESELILKSRRVVPRRLLDAGFRFDYPSWPGAARDLVDRVRAVRSARRVLLN